MTSNASTFTQLRPMLAAVDLDRTMRFWTSLLGFRVVAVFASPGAAAPVWCHLARDAAHLMFNQVPADRFPEHDRRARDVQSHYLNVTNVAALHAACLERGLPVSDLRVTIYGMREFEFRDPDDHRFIVGEPA